MRRVVVAGVVVGLLLSALVAAGSSGGTAVTIAELNRGPLRAAPPVIAAQIEGRRAEVWPENPPSPIDYSGEVAWPLSAAVANGGHNAYSVFFFHEGQFVGRDAARPGTVMFLRQVRRDEVTIYYSTYHEGDGGCCPSGLSSPVRFRWNDRSGVVQRLDPMPTSR